MDVYKIKIMMSDCTRQNTHMLSHDARSTQRIFAFAAQEKGFVVHWETIEIVGNEREIGRRHRISKKRRRQFECSFKSQDGFQLRAGRVCTVTPGVTCMHASSAP